MSDKSPKGRLLDLLFDESGGKRLADFKIFPGRDRNMPEEDVCAEIADALERPISEVMNGASIDQNIEQVLIEDL